MRVRRKNEKCRVARAEMGSLLWADALTAGRRSAFRFRIAALELRTYETSAASALLAAPVARPGNQSCNKTRRRPAEPALLPT